MLRHQTHCSGGINVRVVYTCFFKYIWILRWRDKCYVNGVSSVPSAPLWCLNDWCRQSQAVRRLMWTEWLPWYSDVCTAVCPVFLGHFCFARDPGGLYGDKALHDRQWLSPWLSSAPSLTHTHTRTHSRTHTRRTADTWGCYSWVSGTMSTSVDVRARRSCGFRSHRCHFPHSSQRHLLPDGPFLSYLLLCPVFIYNRLTFQRGNTVQPYAFLRYQRKWITLHSKACFSVFQSFIWSTQPSGEFGLQNKCTPV